MEIPEGIAPDNLYIALWDPDGLSWVDLGGTIDTGAGTVSVPINHLSIYALMAHNRPANLALTKFIVTPDEITLGDAITASVEINNQGDLTETYEADLMVDGVTVQNKVITLNGCNSETITFNVILDTEGTHQVSIGGLTASVTVKKPPTEAAFTVSGLQIDPSSVPSGAKIDISVYIENTGELAGTYPLTLSVDGVSVETKEITLDGGSSLTAIFSFLPNIVGEHMVSIGGIEGVIEVTPPFVPAITVAPELEFISFSTTPIHKENTNILDFIRIEFQMNKNWTSLPDARLIMNVFYNGEATEKVPLFTLGQLQDDGGAGSLNYVPAVGWEAGEYIFQVELHNGENLVQGTLSHTLTVTQKEITTVFRWWTLGAIIGVATILIIALLVMVIYHRRDMLRY
jgi:hypothetical protein